MMFKRFAALASMCLFATGANAGTVVNWADLTTAAAGTVSGTITTPTGSVGVTFTGPYSFAQTSGGTNFWTESTPAPYTGGSVDNAPGTPDIIALSTGGLKTITFSSRVSDVYLALVSWNGNAGSFNQPIQTISSGCGFWGCGGFTNVSANSFDATGELHGVIRFTGAFDQITFTDRSENWHGIQIGIAGIAPAPEPAVWVSMILGFGVIGRVMRRRNGGHSYSRAALA